MKELGRFDPDLEMFIVDKPVDPSMNHLRDLRRRAERNEFGYSPYSVPKGGYVFRLSDPEIKKYAMQQADVELKPTIGLRKGDALMAHIAKHGDY